MIRVVRKENESFEKMMRRFSAACKHEKVCSEFRRRSQYEKPCDQRRRKQGEGIARVKKLKQRREFYDRYTL